MLPTASYLDKVIEEKKQPSRTFRLENGRLRGFTDGLQAVEQAVLLALNTERYEHVIYGWDYGTELEDLFGRPEEYVRPELERRIREALLQDDRILRVEDFAFEKDGRALKASFTVRTEFGDLREEQEIGL